MPNPIGGSRVEKLCKQLIDRNQNLLVPWYLMTSYLYYIENETIISDGLFNDICERLNATWDVVEHRHKHLIDRDNLSASTGYTLQSDDYPGIVKGSALRLLHE